MHAGSVAIPTMPQARILDPVGHGIGVEEMLFGGRGQAARATLLQERKRGFEETVKPIEPYVLVVMLFAIPLVVASTSSCKAQTRRAWSAEADPELPCELVCHAVLALRAASLYGNLGIIFGPFL